MNWNADIIRRVTAHYYLIHTLPNTTSTSEIIDLISDSDDNKMLVDDNDDDDNNNNNGAHNNINNIKEETIQDEFNLLTPNEDQRVSGLARRMDNIDQQHEDVFFVEAE
jgi:hypothetical protein